MLWGVHSHHLDSVVIGIMFQIWQQVKGTNPGLTVCEVGATIGRMWRELSDFQKQQFNEDFVNDKV